MRIWDPLAPELRFEFEFSLSAGQGPKQLKSILATDISIFHKIGSFIPPFHGAEHRHLPESCAFSPG